MLMPVTRLRRTLAVLIVVAATFAVAQVSDPAAASAQEYSTILAAPDRSEADRLNDKRRDALTLLTFIGPKIGWSVLDLGAGAGYSTELMARAVGPTGRVWGQNDKPSAKLEERLK